MSSLWLLGSLVSSPFDGFIRPMAPEEPQDAEIARQVISEADRRAQARGLTAEEIEAESDDDGSEYWDDVRKMMAELHSIGNERASEGNRLLF
jgi:hypothetical protein